MLRYFSEFRRNQDGNIAVTAALMISVLFICVGVAIDTSRLHTTRQNLQDISDGAALMAVVGSDGSRADVQAVVKAASGEMSSVLETDLVLDEPVVDLSDNVVSVTLSVEVPLMFGGIIGTEQMTVSADSQATYGPDIEIGHNNGAGFPETSVVFVFDASGSMKKTMGESSRIVTLKSSVDEFFDDVEADYEADSDLRKNLRAGVYSYNWGIRDRYSDPISRGWTQTVGSVQAIKLSKATIPAQAMEVALWDLEAEPKFDSEGEPRNRVLVFMTDGEVDDHLKMKGKKSEYHNYKTSKKKKSPSFTERTLDVCRRAQSQGIIVIAVGMDAPLEGRELLQDCVQTGSLEDSFYKNTLDSATFSAVLEEIIPRREHDVARLIQ